MFDYPTPFNDRLKEKYGSKYRFSDEIIDAVLYMFTHPKHNKRWYKMCNELMSRDDANDMLKPAYRLFEEFKANPQHYGEKLENMADQMIVSMWRVFISLHTKARKNITSKDYKGAAVKTMSKYCKGVFLQRLVECTYVEASVIKVVDKCCGLGTHEGSRNFEYLCSLAEEEQGSLL